MKYVDFAIRFVSVPGHPYQVFASSPSGTAQCDIELPFSPQDLPGVIRGVCPRMSGAAETPRDAGPSSARPVTSSASAARALGASLYRGLFRDDVRSLFERTLGSTSRREGVRIRLNMDLQTTGTAELASLPWELMARSETEHPLAMSVKTLLVRSPDAPQPFEPVPFEPPLRILVVIANPAGTAPLKLAEERRRIERTWGNLAGVRIDFVRPCRQPLLDQLAKEDYQVIHFMGHGDVDHQSGKIILLLEREDGSPDPISGDTFSMWIRDEPLLRLVFLNACFSGAFGGNQVHPFAGIATSLIHVGVPAVVAMQFPISDDAAIQFADCFYSRVVDGFPVDAAVTEARKALWDSPEWATPVLFMRSADGRLFDRLDPAQTALPAPAQTGTAIAVSSEETAVNGLGLAASTHCLVSVDQTAPAREVVVGNEPLTIGRDPAQTLAFDDNELSRLHAQVSVREGQLVVEDLRSRNGTFVDDVRVMAATVVPEGSVIRLGRQRLRYERRRPASHVVGLAGLLPSTSSTGTHDDGAATGPVDVFLAAPCDQLRPVYRQLQAELQGAGFTLGPVVPPPFDSDAHARTVLQAVKRARLCVHLLGDRPGEPIDATDPSVSYTLAQLRVARESSAAQLILIPEHLDIEAFADDAYADVIRSLAQRPRDADRFELVRAGIHQMRELVVTKLRRLAQARANASARMLHGIDTAFVDTHTSDLPHAARLADYLVQRQVTPIMMPSGSTTPAAAMSLFESNLQKSSLLLVVFGAVSREWVVARLNAAARTVTTHGMRTRIGVYVAPPEKQAEALRFPPIYDVARNTSGFDPSAVDKVLARAAESADEERQ